MSKELPLVSVIVPSLPSHKKQREEIEKMVNNQTYKNIELFFEMQGSNAQEARNIAIKKARGKYIAMLDDDDSWHPKKLEKQVELMEKNDDCGICITYTEDMRISNTDMDYTPHFETTYISLLRGFSIAPTSSFLIRKICLDKYGLFDESFRFAHEYELAIRIASHRKRILCVEEYLTYYGINSDERLSDNYADYIRGHFDLIGKWGWEMAKDSILFALLKQTATIPLFLIGLISVDFAHKFFYKFKHLHTGGKL